MAKINGRTIVVEVDGVAVAAETSATLNLNQDLPDATSKDSAGWAEHINGLRDWSVDVEALTDWSDTFGADGIADAIINQSGVTVKFTNNNSGDVEFTGTANASGLTLTAENEATSTWSGTLTGTGALTKQTVA